MRAIGANRQQRPMTLDEVLVPWPRLGRLEFSPDGAAIIYEFDRALWAAGREGNTQRLTEGRAPHWSPNSALLAFLTAPPPKIWTRDAEGREAQRTSLPRGISDYAWFQDGRRFAAICAGEEAGHELWIVTVDSGEARRIEAELDGFHWGGWSNLAVHPGGRWVAL